MPRSAAPAQRQGSPELPHRLARIRRLEDDGGVALHPLEDAAQRLADQHMIVDDKNLHATRTPAP
jgi:hypothetical protein